MLRIVKMTFKPDAIEDFTQIFEASKPLIEDFPGCQGVDLMQDINDRHIIMTHSTWDGPEALEAYRTSDLFRNTWAKTKVLFADKPLAWSLRQIG
jgi:heme-degrading monooxygenase HmoA